MSKDFELNRLDLDFWALSKTIPEEDPLAGMRGLIPRFDSEKKPMLGEKPTERRLPRLPMGSLMDPQCTDSRLPLANPDPVLGRRFDTLFSESKDRYSRTISGSKPDPSEGVKRVISEEDLIIHPLGYSEFKPDPLLPKRVKPGEVDIVSLINRNVKPAPAEDELLRRRTTDPHPRMFGEPSLDSIDDMFRRYFWSRRDDEKAKPITPIYELESWSSPVRTDLGSGIDPVDPIFPKLD